MKKHLRTLVYTVAAFYAGCLVPFALMLVPVLLLSDLPSLVANVFAGLAAVAGLATMPLVFNWLDSRWPRSKRIGSDV